VVDKRTGDCNNNDRASGHGYEGGHGFDAVPEIFEAKVFVGGVLVVVVIGDGDGDGPGVGSALHCIERDGAAEGRKKDDLAAGALDRTDNIGGDGEVDRCAGGRLAVVSLDVGDFGVAKAFFSCWRSVADEVALGANVVDDALLLSLRIDADDKPEVEVSGCCGRDGVGGVGSSLAGGDAVDVQRRFIEEFEEVLAGAVGVAEDELLTEHLVVDGGFGESFLLDGSEGDDAVVEVRDENVAVSVLHAGEKLDEHHGRIGSPVAVVATVQTVVGAVDGDLQVSVAACAEDERLTAGLIDGAIADEPDIAVDEVAVGHEDLFEVSGAGFFFSLPYEADIGLKWNIRGLERTEGGELSEDGGFVVACAAGVDAGFAVDLLDDWGEGFAGLPLGGCYGLAVVVGVEDDGALGAGSFNLTEDDGWDGGGKVGGGKEFCFGAALPELVDEEFGISVEIGGIGGDVWNREEVGELLREFCLTWRRVVVCCLRWRLATQHERRRNDGEHQGKVPHVGHEENLACRGSGRS
jgi:hypothetical protein